MLKRTRFNFELLTNIDMMFIARGDLSRQQQKFWTIKGGTTKSCLIEMSSNKIRKT